MEKHMVLCKYTKTNEISGVSDYVLRIEGHLPVWASDHQNPLAQIKIQLPGLCILLLRCESD